MVPAKFAPLLFSFFADHYVLCGVGRGNAERGRPVGWTHRVMGDGMVQKLDCRLSHDFGCRPTDSPLCCQHHT